jgi:putative membrane protein
MLSVHLVLSVVSVPPDNYAITLGLTHRPAELARINKAKVGRVAVYAWITSLVLGVLTYMMLQIYPTTISQGALTLPQFFQP